MFWHLGYFSGLLAKKGQGSRGRCAFDAGTDDVVDVGDVVDVVDVGDVGDAGDVVDVGDVGYVWDTQNGGDFGGSGNGGASKTNASDVGCEPMNSSGGASGVKLLLPSPKGGRA